MRHPQVGQRVQIQRNILGMQMYAGLRGTVIYKYGRRWAVELDHVVAGRQVVFVLSRKLVAISS